MSIVAPDPREHDVSEPMRVLVVDDDAGTRDALGDILRFRGHMVRTAAEGREGLEMLATCPVDVAIVDIKLPDINGLDLLDAIKRASPQTEVVIVTGYASIATATQAISGAAFAYLTKPFEMDHLLATVQKAREKRDLVRKLGESQERYRLVTEHIHDAVFLTDLEGQFLFGNPRLEALTGYLIDELLGRSIFTVLTPEGVQAAEARRDSVASGGDGSFFYETEFVRKDGTRVWVEVNSTSVVEGGRTIARLGAARDISQRKAAEAALRESEERYRIVTEHILDAVFLLDMDGRLRFANAAAENLTGYRRDELVGQPSSMFLTTESAREIEARKLAVAAGVDVPLSYTSTILRKDGSRVRIEASSTGIVEGGRMVGRVAVARDLTQRVEAERALRESEERFRVTFEQAGVGIAVVAPSGRFLRANQRLCDMVGYGEDELSTRTFQEITHPDDLPKNLARYRRMASGETDAYSLEKRYLHKDGSVVWVDLTVSVVRDASGAPAYSIAVVQDITQRHAAESALRESEERFRAVVEQAAVGIAVMAPDGRFFRVNRRLCEMIGYAPGELEAHRFHDVTHPDDLDLSLIRRAPLLANETSAYSIEKRYIHKNGATVWVEVTVSPISDPSGERGYSIAVIQDITARKQLEEELHHAQRMEGVGQLAGGIAHDFNNLLTVISGRSQLALDYLDATHPLRRDLELVHKTANRAAALTRQLLAFSRKQVLQPKVVALNELVVASTKLLKHLIGEHIELTFVAGADLGSVRVDPGQIEQVIVNLVVNARDAMPGGGQLTLETANVGLDETYAARHVDVAAGRYVALTVADTGAGMSREVQARIFEPFFTTKGPGKGTGLGLATVYGIVKQSGGHLRVYSEPGIGTTFKIYLPRTDAAPETQAAQGRSALPRGTETILLVEDEPEVRSLAREVLDGLGYTVLEAGVPTDAILIAQRHVGIIDLLLTDVVMPHMSGRALAEAVAAERRETKILFMSGYTDDAIIRHRVLETGTHFLEKPFTPQALATKVREVLDSPAT